MPTPDRAPQPATAGAVTARQACATPKKFTVGKVLLRRLADLLDTTTYVTNGTPTRQLATAHTNATSGQASTCIVPFDPDAPWWHATSDTRDVTVELRHVTDAKTPTVVVTYRPLAPTVTECEHADPKVGLVTIKNPTSHAANAAATKKHVANYTPKTMDADRWALAAKPVRDAVLLLDLDSQSTSSLLAVLTRFLNMPMWDGQSTPNLSKLLNEPNIAAFIDLMPKNATAGIYASGLRRIRKTLNGTPTDYAEGGVRYPHPLLVEGMNRPIPTSHLLATWMHLTGNAMDPNVMGAVAKSFRKHSPGTDFRAFDSTVTPSSTIRSLTEATITEKATVTSQANNRATNSAPTPVKPLTRKESVALAKKARDNAARAANPTVTNDFPHLSAELRERFDKYQPLPGPSRDTWTTNRDLAYRLVAGHQPPSPNSLKFTCSYVATFLNWWAWSARRTAEGHTNERIAPEELLNIDLVDNCLSELTLTARSKGTMRSVLRRALRSLNPEATPEKVPHFAVLGPYTDHECATFAFVAANQPTDIRTTNGLFIVGLGLGVGIDSGDINTLSRNSFHEAHIPGLDHTVLLVTVTRNGKTRTVPVRNTYADLVREALRLHRERTDDDNAPLIGTSRTKNTVSAAIDRLTLADGTRLDIDTRRLRATWLVTAMSNAIPLADLMRAAGLASSRSFAELLEFCPPTTPEHIQAVLADMDDVLSAPDPAYTIRQRRNRR